MLKIVYDYYVTIHDYNWPYMTVRDHTWVYMTICDRTWKVWVMFVPEHVFVYNLQEFHNISPNILVYLSAILLCHNPFSIFDRGSRGILERRKTDVFWLQFLKFRLKFVVVDFQKLIPKIYQVFLHQNLCKNYYTNFSVEVPVMKHMHMYWRQYTSKLFWVLFPMRLFFFLYK